MRVGNSIGAIVAFALLNVTSQVHAQYAVIHVQTHARPADDAVEKARRASTLGQAGSKPFHLRVEITQASGAPGDYNAVIDETWISPTRWSRQVTAPGLVQNTVVDNTGRHVWTDGEYFPLWLQGFILGMFLERSSEQYWSPDNNDFNAVNNCLTSSYKIPVPSTQQIGRSTYCFSDDGLLAHYSEPVYNIAYEDYSPFQDIQVARKLSTYLLRVKLVGRVTVLDTVGATDNSHLAVPENATPSDPLAVVVLSRAEMLDISGGAPSYSWPKRSDEHGTCTAWVGLDRTGRVREAYMRESDDTDVAATLIPQLLGLQWKPVIRNGAAVEAEGPVVIAYPPPASP